ncbi:MAG TPA: hypothetical protein VFJ17_02315 [Mycobacteriales bacterium]|jgi:nitrite reductase (NO-forming)|nr:hypothetical protein [Mycobacteriales bacterium]
MTLRPLPMAGVREPAPRAVRHTVMAAVVGGYLLAALVVVVANGALSRPRWLALHLVGLGAATNAVLVWSRHFAQALLHARVTSERAAHARLVILNAAVIAVLIAVPAGATDVAAAAGFVVVGIIGWHVVSLAVMARRHQLRGPLRRVVGFFVTSALSLVIGAGFGSALAGGWAPDDSTTQQRLHLAHAQLNLLGWIGMAVLGAEVVLWPAVLRTRMAPQAPRLAPVTLYGAVTGLGVLVTGILTGSRPAAVTGAAVYAAAVAVAIFPMILTLPGRPSRTSSAWWLAAATIWLLAGVVVDATRLATVNGADAILHPLVPLMVLGLIVQALVGALTFLLPVTVGGGPAGNRRMAGALERGWQPRFVLANIGTLLVALPSPAAVHTAGWVLAIVGFGAFLPLLAAALAGSDVVRGWRTRHQR